MIVSIDLEKILPDAYRELAFEFMDDVSLAIIRKHYKREFSKGSIVSWTNPDHGTEINIRFESDEDGMLFAMRWL